MSAPIHPAGPPPGAGTRLPWWGLVLPVLAFAALLALLLSGAGSAAEQGHGPVGQLLEYARQAAPAS